MWPLHATAVLLQRSVCPTLSSLRITHANADNPCHVAAMPSLQAVIIPEGGHHLDLMFSNPKDPQSVKDAREAEVANIGRWITEFQADLQASHFSGS
jgi:hypothetical protein